MTLKVVFIGASTFGARCLEACLSVDEVETVGVLTAPETFSISYRPEGVKNVLHTNFRSLVKDLDIPVLTLGNGMNDEDLYRSIKSLKPDIFLVAGWYHMIPKRWRELAPCYGLHASLLPKYSGGAPLVWAMINGEEKTGISLFKMDDGVDTGDIYGQREVCIKAVDTIATLYQRIENLGVDLVKNVLPSIADGTANYVVQDLSERTVFRQRSPSDGEIDWNKKAADVDRFIRAQTKPYPGAFSFYNDRKIYIWSAKVEEKLMLPGEVVRVGDGFLFGCAEGAIRVLDFELN